MVHAFAVPNAVSALSTLPRVPAANDGDARSFDLDQLVREHTAGKCYRPARPARSCCPECLLPVSSREKAAWHRAPESDRYVVYHARCAL